MDLAVGDQIYIYGFKLRTITEVFEKDNKVAFKDELSIPPKDRCALRCNIFVDKKDLFLISSLIIKCMKYYLE